MSLQVESLFTAALGLLAPWKVAVVLSLFLVTAAMAEGPTCNAAAAEKKLAGAAKASFLKKCEKDAAAACQAASKEKKLSGAAKTSFEKKCIKDAVGCQT